MDGAEFQKAIELAMQERSDEAALWLLGHTNTSTTKFKPQASFSSVLQHLLRKAVCLNRVRLIEALISCQDKENKSNNNNSDNAVNIINAADEDGMTALMLAAHKGHLFSLQVLLRKGADPNVRHAKSGQTALHLAVARLDVHAAAALTSAGAAPIDPQLCRRLMPAKRLDSEKNNTHAHRLLSALLLQQQQQQTAATTVVEQLAQKLPDYRAAQEAERKADYRRALHHLARAHTAWSRQVAPYDVRHPTPPWAQLQLDQERYRRYLYGVRGSDGRSAVWRPHVFADVDAHPTGHQFYAWAASKTKIYRHGGLAWMKLVEQRPGRDQLYVLDVTTKQWSQPKTFGGQSPGPRAYHRAVIHRDALYVLGGIGKDGPADMKVYRLHLETYAWSVVKAKGLKPGSRREFAACVYQNHLYIHGGENFTRTAFYNDLWAFSFATGKWKELSCNNKNNNTPRKAHCMWAARGKLWLYGGIYFPPGITDMQSAESTRDFMAFDLKERSWEKLVCVGDDPWDLAESCSIPLFHGAAAGDDEPKAFLVWGGYSEKGSKRGTYSDMLEDGEVYGDTDDVRDDALPYRKRLLYFDIDLMVWTKLDSAQDLLCMGKSVGVHRFVCCCCCFVICPLSVCARPTNLSSSPLTQLNVLL